MSQPDDKSMAMASVIAALRMGEGEGDPINQYEAAELSALRRVDERVAPPSQPAEEATIASLVHAGQFVVAVNLTGPGRGHCPRSALGVGVRFLQCAATPDDLHALVAQAKEMHTHESLYILPTHVPVPLFASGPPMDKESSGERTAFVIKSYEAYLCSMDAEFKRRFEDRLPATDDDNKDDDDDDVQQPIATRATTNSMACPDARHRPTHHAFFVVAFVPEVKQGVKCYAEPILAVFGSFADEPAAERYGLTIASQYPCIEPCVVKGGEWLYPRVLGEPDASSIKTIFPNAANLERIVTSLQRNMIKQTQ